MTRAVGRAGLRHLQLQIIVHLGTSLTSGRTARARVARGRRGFLTVLITPGQTLLSQEPALPYRHHSSWWGKYQQLLQTPRSAQLALSKGEDDENSGYTPTRPQMKRGRCLWWIHTPFMQQQNIRPLFFCLAATSSFVPRSESHLCSQKKNPSWFIKIYPQ